MDKGAKTFIHFSLPVTIAVISVAVMFNTVSPLIVFGGLFLLLRFCNRLDARTRQLRHKPSTRP